MRRSEMPFDFAIVMKSSDKVAAMSVRSSRTYTGICPADSTSTGRIMCLKCSTGSVEKLTNSVAGSQWVWLIENTYQSSTAITKFGIASSPYDAVLVALSKRPLALYAANTAMGTDTTIEKMML